MVFCVGWSRNRSMISAWVIRHWCTAHLESVLQVVWRAEGSSIGHRIFSWNRVMLIRNTMWHMFLRHSIPPMRNHMTWHVYVGWHMWHICSV